MITPANISIAVHNALLDVVSDYVYDGNPPKKLPPNAENFIIHDVGSIRPAYDYDEGQFVRSYLIVNMFVKNKSNGVKNTVGVSELADSVMEALKSIDDFRLSLSSLESFSSKVDNYTGYSVIYNIVK